MPEPTPDDDPFAQLQADHRLIEDVLDALETAEDVDLAFYRDAVQFIRVFADGAHHEKEERHLFPALERRGILKEMGPIGVLLEEHEAGRRLTANMTNLIDAGDLAGLRREGRAYAALLRDHIAKEEQALFMLGRALLPPQDAADVCAGFDTVACGLDPELMVEALRRRTVS